MRDGYNEIEREKSQRCLMEIKERENHLGNNNDYFMGESKKFFN